MRCDNPTARWRSVKRMLGIALQARFVVTWPGDGTVCHCCVWDRLTPTVRNEPTYFSPVRSLRLATGENSTAKRESKQNAVWKSTNSLVIGRKVRFYSESYVGDPCWRSSQHDPGITCISFCATYPSQAAISCRTQAYIPPKECSPTK